MASKSKAPAFRGRPVLSSDMDCFVTPSNIELALSRAQEWYSGKFPAFKGPSGNLLFQVLDQANDGTDIEPKYKVFFGVGTDLYAVVKFHRGAWQVYFQIYMKTPSYQDQKPALRVTTQSGMVSLLYLWGKVYSKNVKRLEKNNGEKLLFSFQKDQGGKCCCCGTSRVVVSVRDPTGTVVMKRDQINETLSLTAGQNVLVGMCVAWAMDRRYKFLGSNVEKNARGTSAMASGGTFFGLAGVAVGQAIDRRTKKVQHGMYHIEELNNIK